MRNVTEHTVSGAKSTDRRPKRQAEIIPEKDRIKTDTRKTLDSTTLSDIFVQAQRYIHSTPTDLRQK